MMTLRQILRLACASVLLLGSATGRADDDTAFLTKARAELDKGEPKAAVIQLKNALQQDPADLEARLLLGEVYLRMDQPQAAEQEFRRAEGLHAAKPRWEPGLGEALLRQGRFADLLSTIKVDESQPVGNREAELLLRGKAQIGAKQLDDADKSLDAALALAPGDSDVLVAKARIEGLRGQLDAAMKLVNEALAKAPNSVDGLLVRGELRRRKGDLAGMATDYTRLLELDPGHVQARVALAAVQFAQNDLKGALAQLAALPAGAQGLGQVVLLRALVYAKQGRFADAEEQVQLILRVAPENTQAQLLYGVLAYDEGKLDLAVDMLTRAVAKLPESAQLSKLLGAVRLRAGKPDQAVPDLEAAARKHPDDAQLLALLGSAYLRSGDTDRGIEVLGRAVKAAPNVASLRTELALSLLIKGEAGAAVSELQSAVKLDDNLLQAEALLVFSQIRQKDYDRAVSTAQGLVTRRPKDPFAYNLAGVALMARGDQAKAKEQFRKALRIDPSFFGADLNLARLALLDKDPDRAETHFKKVLEKHPDNRQALLGMLTIAEERGDTAALGHWVAEARKRQPGIAAFGVIEVRYLLSKKEEIKALGAAEDLSHRFPKDLQVLEVLGRAQLAADHAASAAATFQTLAGRHPDSAEVWLLGALADEKAGNRARAKESLERALKIDPHYVPAQTALARLALAEGDTQRAVEVARALQSAKPDLPLGYDIAGAALTQSGKASEAAAMYRKSYEIRPSRQAALNLSGLYSKLDNPAEAEAALKSWLEQRPEDTDALRRLAILYQLGQKPKEAQRLYERIREIAPDDAVVANNLAWLYFQIGDPRAVETAGQAYQLAPNHPEVLDTYGWVLAHKGGDAAKAVNLLQQAMLTAPHDPSIAYHTAFALHAAGRDAEARKILQTLLAEQPQSKVIPDVRKLLEQL